ncbi:DUF3489 domain-containing protein [Hyphomonas sp.]|uniref:DUF3489 domain-containing protein n=1 Tax=Hyphomonas sp. TaxID=87 RepID=UPI00356780F9
MARTIRLNDIQLVLLCTAAGREDRMVLPPPQSVPLDDPETKKALQGLLRRRLVEEAKVPLDAPTWRIGEGDQPLGLVIAAAGFDAIGLSEMAGDPPASAKKETHPTCPKRRGKDAQKSNAAEKPMARRPKAQKGKSAAQKTKASAVLTLLRRKSGTTLPQLMEATGWQPHSVRGFLSGTVKTRMGLTLTSEKPNGGERRYRVQGGKA